jgi:phasin family protein
MNALQTARFPFANTDMTKAWSIFRFPSINFEALFEAHRKNAAALTRASQVVFDGLKTLAQCERNLFKSTIDDYTKATSDFLASASIEERATKQADAARQIFVSNVVRCRELSDIAVKTNVIAVDILNARISEVFDEFRALVAPATATSLEPTPVIAEPVAVVGGVAPAPKTAARAGRAAPKRAARAAKAAPRMARRAAKTVRRPTSRG